MSDLHLVLDVESVGLQGEGFAVGWVVIDLSRSHDKTLLPEVESGIMWASAANARGVSDGQKWVEANVKIDGLPTHLNLFELRGAFWDRVWIPWKKRGVKVWADHAWPVEARFLAACADDALQARGWEGPYPLHEIETLRWALEIARPQRVASELPTHNPLADARYGARILLTALESLKDPSVTSREEDPDPFPGPNCCPHGFLKEHCEA